MISPGTALERLQAGALGLDVRSQKEFRRGSLQGFANVPILNDEHRHLVGLTYKQESQARAIELGLDLVTPLRDALECQWREWLEPVPGEMRLLICWRGGLRSQIAAEWLAEKGFRGVRVNGGYKALRGELLKQMDRLPQLLVLGGMTGTGKTEALSGLDRRCVVDLEALARHRGSAFGLAIHETQPTQQTFENCLGFAFHGRESECLVEDESAMIGQCFLPPQVRQRMSLSPLVVLEAPMHERVRRVYNEYVVKPVSAHPRGRVRQHLLDSLERIGRRLGGKRASEIRKQIFEAFARPEITEEAHAPWIESLLSGYYDPAYAYSLERKPRQILFHGDARAVQDFLADRFSGRRP